MHDVRIILRRVMYDYRATRNIIFRKVYLVRRPARITICVWFLSACGLSNMTRQTSVCNGLFAIWLHCTNIMLMNKKTSSLWATWKLQNIFENQISKGGFDISRPKISNSDLFIYFYCVCVSLLLLFYSLLSTDLKQRQKPARRG